MKKIILIILIILSTYVYANPTKNFDYYVYVDTSMEFVTYLPNVVDKTVNINLYFKNTDSAILISDGNVTFKSNTLELNKQITINDILSLLNTDFYIDNDTIVSF